MRNCFSVVNIALFFSPPISASFSRKNWMGSATEPTMAALERCPPYSGVHFRELTVVKNPTRLATWPNKLIENFRWFGEDHIYWPIAIPCWHLAFQTHLEPWQYPFETVAFVHDSTYRCLTVCRMLMYILYFILYMYVNLLYFLRKKITFNKNIPKFPRSGCKCIRFRCQGSYWT